MNYPVILLLFVIFSTKDFPSSHSTTTLKNRKVSPEVVDYVIREAFFSAEAYKVKKVEYKIGAESERKTNGLLQNFFGGFFGTKTTTTAANPDLLQKIFGTKIIFYGVNLYFHDEDKKHTTTFSLVPQYISDDQISISTDKLRITLEVELRRETNEPFSGFGLFTTLHFKDFVLNATRINETKYDFEFSYEDYFLWHHGDEVKIKWRQYQTYYDRSALHDLASKIIPILPLLLREHINRNPQFPQAFEKIIARSY